MFPQTAQSLQIRSAMLAALAVLILTPLITFPAKSASGSDGPIAVHGKWVVIVSSPEGKELQRYAFSNALTDAGKQFLKQLLLRNVLIEPFSFDSAESVWRVNPAFWTGVSNLTSCVRVIRGGPSIDATNTSDQERTSVSATENTFTLTRSFSLPASCLKDGRTDYSFGYVATWVLTNYEGSARTEWPSWTKFTEKSLGQSIVVLPDQVVTLQATISFE